MSAPTNYEAAANSLRYLDDVGRAVKRAVDDGVPLDRDDLLGFQSSTTAGAQIAQVQATLALVDELRKIRQIMAPGST